MAGLTLEDATKVTQESIYPNGNMSQWLKNYRTSQQNNRYPNAYTRQSPIITPNNNLSGAVPTNPSTQPGFLENYRATTKQLGGLAKAWEPDWRTKGVRPTVDAETKSIMDRIKLPTYSDALTPEQTDAFRKAYNENEDAAMQDIMNKTAEWDEDNFYYKLRAAQILKKMPKAQRENYLDNFDISMYDAKNELDKVIDKENQKDYDAYLRATGQRTSYTDEDGVTTTTTITEGPGDLDELARILGKNNSFRFYSKSDYDENGELTEEAKSRGPSSWSAGTTSTEGQASSALASLDGATRIPTPVYDTDTSNTPSLDGSGVVGPQTAPSDEEGSGETIEYTYEPGDTFGQVLVKLGLVSDHGLWGEDGDVEYYTKQLEKQGIWPEGERGNIPIGTTIKLRRRK